MTDRLRVGVAIITRDCAAHVAAAIASVLDQEPAPADVVVLDGGSTDGTVEAAGAFPGVRVIPQVGLGLGAARNQALRHIEGDLLAFCDCDDRWRPGSLALRLARFRESPECDAVIGRVVTAPLEGEVVPEHRVAGLDRDVSGYTPGALLARRNVFDAVGPFSESLRIGADSDWFVRLTQSGCRLAELDDVVLTKGLREDALSTQVDAYRREMLEVARSYVIRRRSQR